jgi:1,4-dihydroxy-2-naphthoyl-CoA hydrolase
MMRAVDADATALVHRTMPLCATLDVVAHEFGRDRVVLGLGWRPELCTSNGLLHGGAVMVLADSAGAACAFANLPDGAVGTSTIESKTNFVGAVTAGTVVATSTVLHRGSTTIVIETDVRDDADRLVAKVTQTQIVLRPRASAP